MKLKSLLQENVQLDYVDSPDQLESITDVVDVTGYVDLFYRNFTSLPAKFGKVDGNFNCNNNHLTSLEGCPTEVDGNFNCYANNLTSLEGCPTEVGGDFCCDENNLTSLEGCPNEVGGDFYCHYNRLTSLEGCPTEVGGDFYCHINQLTSLVGIHKLIKKMDGTFYVIGNPIKEGGIGLLLIDGIKEIYADHSAFDIINKYLSQGKMGILACQEELIENGYEAFTKL